MPSCQQVRYSHSGSQMTPNTRGRRLTLLVGPQRGGRLGGAFMPMDVSDEMSVVFGPSRAVSLAAFQVICQ
jgi:hypothetical protein